MVLNASIRSSRLYDGVEDFDAATLDPSTGNMLAEYLPNSTFTQLPWDYLHPNHAGYIAMGESISSHSRLLIFIVSWSGRTRAGQGRAAARRRRLRPKS